MMAPGSFSTGRNGVNGNHSRHPSLVGLPLHGEFEFGGMSTLLNQRGLTHGLPKLETQAFNNIEFGSMRTAPPIGGFGNDLDLEGLFFSGSTINPNALHYSESPQSMAIDSVSPYHQSFPDITASQTMDENFDWMIGFEHQMTFNGASENAIDGSSPSAISTASQSGISEVMLDGSNNQAGTSGPMWQQSMVGSQLMSQNAFSLDLQTSGFPDLFNGGPISPHGMPQRNANDPYFSTPPPSMSSLSPPMMPGITAQGMQQTMAYGPETPSSTNGSPQPISPLSTITDATRQALVIALAQCSPFGGRKYSFPAVSSPLSPHFSGRSNSVSEAPRGFPSTGDLQRYLGAYIQYFHPHLPFLHIPTLSFDVSQASNGRNQSGTIGGRGCLLLSMAAIGALYEMERVQSRDLFELAKKMIQFFLEKADVRKVDMRKASVLDDHLNNQFENSVQTPLWLVQAMLLNVIYGHNCGDKTAGDIASAHCAALVNLARAVELLTPHPTTQMTDDDPGSDSWTGIKIEPLDEHVEWLNWKATEERKRTLYGIFILSSLLVSAYNHAPALTNSEILLDLPCDEEFWTADSAGSFHARGGERMANHNRMTFYDALGELLRSNEKNQQPHRMSHQPFGSALDMNELPESDLRPSTFGCLVLINALHNYIWEARQHHHNEVWTNEEMEKMHHRIEPALKAWQTAWASNPLHSLERPNPHGLGPLSADSIPLLDLAYVRLFVNLSGSKEKFWQRDWDGMAEVLSRDNEIIQPVAHTPRSSVDLGSDQPESPCSSVDIGDSPSTSSFPLHFNQQAIATQRAHQHIAPKSERHLRKAAFYAADSLSMSDKLGVTFADFVSRELPLQSAMCAFDCAQVLAEWVAAVQARVGRYLGILGRDEIVLNQVPAVMLLEEEDCKLLGKIEEILNSAEIKMNYDLAAMGTAAAMNATQRLSTADSAGYGAKILGFTAYMLDKAAAWPGRILRAFVQC